jgi:hypothetical protein
MAFDLSASRRDRVSPEAAFNLEIGVASDANAGGFILRSAVRELSRPLAQLGFNAAAHWNGQNGSEDTAADSLGPGERPAGERF